MDLFWPLLLYLVAFAADVSMATLTATTESISISKTSTRILISSSGVFTSTSSSGISTSSEISTNQSSSTKHIAETSSIVTMLETSRNPPTSPSMMESTNQTTTTAQPSDDEGPTTQNPGVIAVICIFVSILVIGGLVILVKCCRTREPSFKKLDEVPMGKVAEDSPFARYPPK